MPKPLWEDTGSLNLFSECDTKLQITHISFLCSPLSLPPLFLYDGCSFCCLFFFFCGVKLWSYLILDIWASFYERGTLYNHSNKLLCDRIYLIPFYGGEAFPPFNYPTEAKSLILSSSLCTLLSTTSRWQHGTKFSSSMQPPSLIYLDWPVLQRAGYRDCTVHPVKVSSAARASRRIILFSKLN